MEKKTLSAIVFAALMASVAMPVTAHPHKESVSGDAMVNTLTHDHAGGVNEANQANSCAGKNGEKETSADDCKVSPVSTH